MVDVLELIEVCQDTLDEVWKAPCDKPYPESRMRQLLTTIGKSCLEDFIASNPVVPIILLLLLCKLLNLLAIYFIADGAFCRYIQRHLSGDDLWYGSFPKIKEKLKLCVSICERWTGVCEQLTTHFWKRYAPHPWTGQTMIPVSVSSLAQRLNEVSFSSISHRHGLNKFTGFGHCLDVILTYLQAKLLPI